MILREPDVKDASGGTPAPEKKVEQPTALPSVKPEDIKGKPESTTPPPEALKGTFSLSDEMTDLLGGLEQLPSQQTEKKVEQPKKPDDKAKKDEAARIEKEKQDKLAKEKADKEKADKDAAEKAEKAEKEKQETEKKPALPKYLKPPKGQEPKEEPQKSIHTRDTSWMSPQEAHVAKQMSNDAFELFSKALKENKDLSKRSEGLYLQHENAFVLDPQFQQAQTSINLAGREAQYWQEQLLKIDRGEKWKPITGYDDKGNWIYGPEREPSKLDEEQVRLQLNNTHNVINQLSNNLQQFPNRYRATVQNDLAAIEQYRAQQFDWVRDPKILEYTVPVKDLGERTLKQVRDDVTGLWPPYMRNHPAVKVLGDLAISLILKDAELAELRNGKAIENVLQQEQEKVEPSSDVRQREDKAKQNKFGGPAEFNLAGMREL